FNQVPIVGERGYSENRAYAGVGRRFGRWTRLSVGYQMQWLKGVSTNFINHTVVLGASFDTPEAKRRSPPASSAGEATSPQASPTAASPIREK
ncbi:MAG: hypothetical protein WBG86_03235, partial [Polyangiales bacterium]